LPSPSTIENNRIKINKYYLVNLALFLKGHRLHSDRNRRKKLNPVRKQASFGQEQKKKAHPSPNASLIRTGTEEKAQPSPKASLIRTGTEEKTQLSPNARLIRTGTAEKSLTQSECKPHSDRNRRKKLNSVRMLGSFGQEQKKKA
jgi:hypothetical protein